MSEDGQQPAGDRQAERRAARLAARQAARLRPERPAPAPRAALMDTRPRRVDVIAAYRWLLGREPENDRIVVRQAADAATVGELRRRLLASAEFREQLGLGAAPGLPPAAPDIATAASAAELDAMQARLAKGWGRLGETAPHWSSLPEPRFRPDRFAANRQAFFASGREDRLLVEGVLRRLAIQPERLGRLVDFGCGVGRATLHLAAICPEVAGVDISRPHLDIAREEARGRGMDHIAWLRSRVDQPMPAEGYGLWFSRRVLQHCPPPLSRHLLGLAFAGLAPGGVAVFQLLTHGFGYAFAQDEPSRSADGPAGELHALPQAEIFALAAAAGLSVLELQEDPHSGLDRGRWVSHVFVVTRPA